MKINVNEYFTLLLIKEGDKQIPYKPAKNDYLELRQKGMIELNGTNISILQKGIDVLSGVFDYRNYEELTEELRVIYPSGKKDGKYPWRGFSKDISARLRKLDKHAGLEKYSNDDLKKAIKEYVSQFTPQTMDKGMQLLQYFIEKDGNSSLIAWLESEEKHTESSSSMELRL